MSSLLTSRVRPGHRLGDQSALVDYNGLPDVQKILAGIKGARPTTLNIDLNFTGGGVSSTASPTNDRELAFAFVILAAQTNLENVTVQIFDTSRGNSLMDDELPIQVVAALRDSSNPWFPWSWPHVIPPQGHIKIKCTDALGEGAGTLSFEGVAIPTQDYDAGALDDIMGFRPWWESIAVTFNGTASQEIGPYSSGQEDPILVTGFQTVLQSARIKPVFPGNSDLTPDYVPIANYAQPATSFLHFQPLRIPMWLKARQKANLQIKNSGTEASSSIYMYGVRKQHG